MSEQNLQSPTFNLQFDCPDCGGVLLPVEEGGFLHFECEVGHRYSPQTLLTEQHHNTEYAIWEAIRGLTETLRLVRKLQTTYAGERNASEARLERQQEKAITLLREALLELNKSVEAE